MNFNDLNMEAYNKERDQWCRIIEIDVDEDKIWVSNGMVQFGMVLSETEIRFKIGDYRGKAYR